MRRLLAVTDRATPSQEAVERACALAAEHCANLHLLLLLPDGAASIAQAAVASELAGTISALQKRHPCIAELRSSIAVGDGAQSIIGAAETTAADLIIVPGSGATGDTGFATAVVSAIVHDAPAPVLIVQTRAVQPYRTLLVAVDEAGSVDTVLDLACMIDSVREIIGVTAYRTPLGSGPAAEDAVQADHRARLEASMHDGVARHPAIAARCTAVAAPGDVLSVVAGTAIDHDPDLIVIGTHARRGLGLLIHGSVAQAVIAALPFDILIGRLDRPKDAS
jgi:nucleotide-binding universal stress UspA family protein